MKVTKAEVLEFILACMAEAEADGYQQQADVPIHEHNIQFGLPGDGTLWITIGEEEFECQLRKKRKAKG